MGKQVMWSVWFLMSLVFISDLAASRKHVLTRNHRQLYWGDYSRAETGWGSSRLNPVFSSLSGTLSPRPIRVLCMEGNMAVNVQTDLYGNGRRVKVSDLSLGPEHCRPRSQSTTTIVVFQEKLQDCGNTLQMTPEWLIYSTILTHNPTPARNSPIIRTKPAVVPIKCYYLRHGNVSSNAIKPTWLPFSSTISAVERLSFSLMLMTDDWSAPRTSAVFQLGEVLHIEASVDTRNHMPMMVFVDSCVATLSSDITSSPKYDIIAQNGCLMDGKQDDSSSAFKSPRPSPNRLQITVDAFKFTGFDNSMIFITCNLRAAAQNQVPNPSNKACSFSKYNNVWTALEGSSTICSCCDSGNCVPTLGGSRIYNPWYPGQRGAGKREAPSGSRSQEHKLVTLGPLLVVGADRSQALAVTPASADMELWLLVAGAILSFVLALFGVIVSRIRRAEQQ